MNSRGRAAEAQRVREDEQPPASTDALNAIEDGQCVMSSTVASACTIAALSTITPRHRIALTA